MTNKNSRRSHDAFFRWLFAEKNHLRALLKLCAKQKPEIAEFLKAINLNSLEQIPDSYSEVDETGEADLASLFLFKKFPIFLRYSSAKPYYIGVTERT